MKLLPSLILILTILAVGFVLFVFTDHTHAIDRDTPRIAPLVQTV